MCSNTAYLLRCCLLPLLLPTRAASGWGAAGSVLSRSGAQTEAPRTLFYVLLRLRSRRIQPRRVLRVPLTLVLLCVLLFPNPCLLALGFHRGRLSVRDVTELLHPSPGILLGHEHAIVFVDCDPHRVIEPAQAAPGPAHIGEQF